MLTVSVKHGVCSIEPVFTLGYTVYMHIYINNEAFNPVFRPLREEIYAYVSRNKMFNLYTSRG
jgi:hypothetical protein